MKCNKVYDIPREDMKANESCRRVYSTQALSTSLVTNGGGNQEVKVLITWDTYNMTLKENPSVATRFKRVLKCRGTGQE